MSDRWRKLEPPRGGPERFRALLAREPDRRVRPVWVLVPAATAAAVITLWLGLVRHPRPPAHEPVAAIAGSVVQRLSSSNPKVILYAVAPTEGLASAP